MGQQMVVLIAAWMLLNLLCKEKGKKVENPEATRVSLEGYQWLNVKSQGYMTPARENEGNRNFTGSES